MSDSFWLWPCKPMRFEKGGMALGLLFSAVWLSCACFVFLFYAALFVLFTPHLPHFWRTKPPRSAQHSRSAQHQSYRLAYAQPPSPARTR